MDKITAKTGQAPVVKLGHTAGNQYGHTPDARVKGRTPPRELTA